MIDVTLSHYLRIMNVNSLALTKRAYRKLRELKNRVVGGILHAIALEILRGHVVIVRAETDIRFVPLSFKYGVTLGLEHGGGAWSTDFVVALTKELEELADRYGRYTVIIDEAFVKERLNIAPYFILDFSLWELHRDGERGEAYRQVVMLVDTVSKYLLDSNVILVNPPKGLVNKLNSEFDYSYEYFTCIGSECEGAVKGKGIVLDPYAENILTIEDVLEANYFVIGAVIDDKIPRPYATKLIREVNWPHAIPKRIELWGSKVGVPNRVNKIAEILLRIRFDGLNIDEAIVKAMSKLDKLSRIHKEAYAFQSIHGYVRKELVERLCRALEIDPLEALRFLKSRGIVIEGA